MSTVNVHDLSNYGRVLETFAARHADCSIRRTTLVILGDGRTNIAPPGSKTLARLRERARAVLVALPRAARELGSRGTAPSRSTPRRWTRCLEAASAADLERAARELLARR